MTQLDWTDQTAEKFKKKQNNKRVIKTLEIKISKTKREYFSTNLKKVALCLGGGRRGGVPNTGFMEITLIYIY